MKKIIINENQRGLLFNNGKFVKMLTAGKYRTYGGKQIDVVSLDCLLYSDKCNLDVLLADAQIAREVSTCEVADNQLALQLVNGNLKRVLPAGKYAFWQQGEKHEYIVADLSKPETAADIPDYLFTKIPREHYVKIEVAQWQKARLYFNRKLVKLLDAGTYYFWQNGRNGTVVEAELVDTRLTQLNVTGQELLTQDKVSLRINFVCNYRITDCVKVATEVNSFTEQLHVAAQLALREYVGKYKLDDILENKDQMCRFVFTRLKEKEQELFVEISDAGVKDIILPGEVRDIMNTVLVAEKRAQANVITRREEVASTRSLLNTAKLMDENQTLYKLKELEYIERICENVGNINLDSNGNVLAQLTSLLRNG